MAGTYNSIKSTPAVSLQGGLKQKIYIAAYDDFETIEMPDKAAANVADRFKIKEPHTFKAGKGFVEIYITKNTGFVKFSPIGGPDRHSFNAEGEFYHPGEGDEIVAFGNQAIHDRFIILAPLPGSDELIQIGSDEFQVELTPSYDTTKNGDDGRGWPFTFSSYMPYLIKYTASTIPLKPVTP
ncbi:hypothetical protein ACFQ4C_18005 [Larkinella insperata]|uniref:Uncharacterized protein n=1 Tax=Larkinella insperata TaxID=332158 RepID=A0ABW3QJH5_9BACT|nr:hypothetical protein [Larkinella insperata]